MTMYRFDKEPVYIGIGSNKGNRLKLIKQAIASIGQIEGTKVNKIAKVYQSEPLGPGKAKFLNTAVEIYTTLSPFELLASLKGIEEQLGRISGPKWGDRTVDLDILFFGDLVMETDILKIPHPELHWRDFVLLPLSDIAPDLVHPVLKITVNRLIHNAKIQSNCTLKCKSLGRLLQQA